MKDYLIYLDEAYTGIKRGSSANDIQATFQYIDVEYVKEEKVSTGVVSLHLKTIQTAGAATRVTYLTPNQFDFSYEFW